jgi:hypothetical protein
MINNEYYNKIYDNDKSVIYSDSTIKIINDIKVSTLMKNNEEYVEIILYNSSDYIKLTPELIVKHNISHYNDINDIEPYFIPELISLVKNNDKTLLNEVLKDNYFTCLNLIPIKDFIDDTYRIEVDDDNINYIVLKK